MYKNTLRVLLLAELYPELLNPALEWLVHLLEATTAKRSQYDNKLPMSCPIPIIFLVLNQKHAA